MSADQAIDENLYSRQIYVLGVDAMKKLAASSVLISGMNGLGVEIAKNVILAGINNVSIHDTRNCQISDLASNFYLNESHFGQNRALACLKSLSSLNEYVSVSAKSDELTNDFLLQFTCVVIADYHKESEIKRISEFCHQNNIKLILADTSGVFAYLFTDFGESHVVNDPNGEPPSRFLLSFVTNSSEGLVTIAEGEKHNLGDGDHVRFEEVEGMTELNGKEFEVKVRDFKHFTIGDTSQFGKYTSQHHSGYGNQVIVPQIMKYHNFTEALQHHSETIDTVFDFCAFGRDQQVILAFLAKQRILESLPDDTQSCDISGHQIIEVATAINNEYHLVDSIDEQLLLEFERESGCIISPTCATFGGIVGQEIIKAISSKFKPVYQFLAMGYVESLPDKLEEREYTLQNDRYDPYRIIFGNKQQEIMMNLHYFMIGAGALGCEQLKNWALMGVACNPEKKGQIYITDMDSIERSNLNRQFLFRNSDIGKLKSDAAAQAVRVMNSNINIESQQNRIGPESSAIYNDTFYTSLDGVCNALDNVQTRLFSDQMCVFYKKPLLESGTLGPKAHYQTIVPYLTESYGSQIDPPETNIPMCTLHNFPSNIDHCCMWARDKFSGLFEQQPKAVNALFKSEKGGPVETMNNLKHTQKDILTQGLAAVEKIFKTEKCTTYEDCIKWARLLFENLFNYSIRDLQHQFPRDYISSDGLPFWSGKKRYPEVQVYDPSNPYHAEFIKSAADIRARILEIPIEDNAAERAAQITVPEWNPSGKKIQLEDNNNNTENENETDVDIDELDKAIQEASVLLEQNHPVHPEEFEKDDSANGHIDFVSAAANIRALNYQIEPQDKLEIKRIAGKIIPAIATTTAMICGLVALEMYKVHSVVPKPVESFRFGSINLAISSFNLSEPAPAQKRICSANRIEFTFWDNWVINGDLTLNELIEAVKEQYKMVLDSLTIGSKLIYMSFQTLDEKAMNTKISQYLVEKFAFPPFDDNHYLIQLDTLCTDLEGNDVDNMPQLVLNIQG